MNLTKWTSELCEELTFKNYSERTVESYSYHLRAFLLEFSDLDHPRRITEAQIKDYLKQAKSTSTLKQQIGAIKFFYKHIIRQPLKFRYIEYPRSAKKQPIPLSLNEVQRILDAVDNLKHRAILVTLYSAGLRVSELLNLKVSGDIDADKRVIWVRGGKGQKDRHVPLDRAVLGLLRRYFKAYQPKEYLFEGPRGKYSATSARNILHGACDRAGVRRVNPHLLRHSFSTHTIENGHDISILQRMLGHNSIKSTQRYTYISPQIIANTGSPVVNLRI